MRTKRQKKSGVNHSPSQGGSDRGDLVFDPRLAYWPRSNRGVGPVIPSGRGGDRRPMRAIVTLPAGDALGLDGQRRISHPAHCDLTCCCCWRLQFRIRCVHSQAHRRSL
jgi:hypothetical protein